MSEPARASAVDKPGPADRRRARTRLLPQILVMLVAAALLPLAISFYQLRSNEDALLGQVQRTHIIAARTAAERVDVHLERLLAVTSALGENPVFSDAPTSPVGQEILRSTLAAHPEVAGLGVLDADGATVILARKPGLAPLDASLWARGIGVDPTTVPAQTEAESRIDLVEYEESTWILVTTRIENRGHVVLLGETGLMTELVASRELGDQAELVLHIPVEGDSPDSGRRFGDRLASHLLPAEFWDQLRSGKLISGASRRQCV